MQLDLHVSRFDWAGDPKGIGPGVADLAQRAEAIGVRTLSFMDHYFQMDWMAPAEDPMLEGYTALGFVAGRTERLRLRLLVTGVTYRHPGLLAKTVTTLDVLSGGRAELGIGAAWYDREHLGLGVPFPPTAERFERLEETLQICQQMWSDDNGPFEGRHYQLAETICSPMPVSEPRPRILIGGGGERKTLRLVAQYADACNIIAAPDEVAHKIDVLRRHCDAVDRDPSEIEVTAMYRDFPADATVDDIVQGAEALAKIGVSTVVTGAVGNDPAGWLESTFGPAMERIAAIEPAGLN
jgi:F420-dependent oxidoreductase-like protein